MSINELEKIISYKFKEKKYLIEAITHKSTGLAYNYDKLEFLGDRVLGLVIAHKLNTLIQNKNVFNTHLKFESLTNENYLSQVAKKININKFILVQGGKDNNKFKNNDSILSDVLEAIIGGIFLGFLTFFPVILENVFQFSLFKNLTSLIILIGVITDVTSQVEGFLVSKKYEGFKKT